LSLNTAGELLTGADQWQESGSIQPLPELLDKVES
jgi:hypothetical protein